LIATWTARTLFWIPPDEKHWHGATPTTAMSHIAVVEELNDSLGDILEKVGDEQYEGSSNAR
jgi:quercetin dioxygenase-like cupin family protein